MCESYTSRKKVNFDKLIKNWKIYEREAEACEKNKLFLASQVMLGAALESLLILFTLLHLEDEEYPTIKEIKDTTLYELITALEKNAVFSSSCRIPPVNPHILRNARNLIHPGTLILQENKNIAKNYMPLKETYNKIKDHLLYWITDDIDIEED